jgi:hypothetical protein
MGFLLVVGVAFVVSLLGILLTGPVVVRAPAIDLDVGADPARLRASVEKLCTDFAPRHWRRPQNLDRATEWIAAQFRNAGLEVEFQEYEARETRFRNVIGRRAGADPGAAISIVGAHYDVFGEMPGADDNASGVAVLLELARTLSGTPPPRRGQVFVAFGTEEPPFFGSEDMGSHHFARALKERKTPIHLMISLDMVGSFSDAPGSQKFPIRGLGLAYPDRGNFIAVVGDLGSGTWIERVKRGMMATRALPVRSFRASPRWAPVDLSDQWAFRRLGLPGVQVTDTAFLRYPHYHAPEDTPDKLDYDRMALLVEALHGVLREGEV